MARGKYQQWLEPDGLLLLEGWARDGLTDEQIAHNMGITAKTLYEWKNKYSDICEVLKKGKEVVDYYVLPEDIEGGAVITPIDMTLRTAEHSEGIQTQLNLLSSKCGFGENHYRFDQGSIATATQVISENSTMFRTIKKHEIILDQAIKELCRIILRLGNTAMGASLNEEAQVTIDFDDSIIEDKTTERNNDRQDLAAGIMNDWEYRAKWYNEDEVTAKKMLPKMEDMTTEPEEETE